MSDLKTSQVEKDKSLNIPEILADFFLKKIDMPSDSDNSDYRHKSKRKKSKHKKRKHKKSRHHHRSGSSDSSSRASEVNAKEVDDLSGSEEMGIKRLKKIKKIRMNLTGSTVLQSSVSSTTDSVVSDKNVVSSTSSDNPVFYGPSLELLLSGVKSTNQNSDSASAVEAPSKENQSSNALGSAGKEENNRNMTSDLKIEDKPSSSDTVTSICKDSRININDISNTEVNSVTKTDVSELNNISSSDKDCANITTKDADSGNKVEESSFCSDEVKGKGNTLDVKDTDVSSKERSKKTTVPEKNIVNCDEKTQHDVNNKKESSFNVVKSKAENNIKRKHSRSRSRSNSRSRHASPKSKSKKRKSRSLSRDSHHSGRKRKVRSRSRSPSHRRSRSIERRRRRTYSRSHSRSPSRSKYRRQKRVSRSPAERYRRRTRSRSRSRGRYSRRSRSRGRRYGRSRERHRSTSRSRHSSKSRRSFSRSKSRSRSKSKHKSLPKEKSRSRSKSKEKNDTSKKSTKIDQAKVLEIARKNVLKMMQDGTLPEGLSTESLKIDQVVSSQAGGKSVQELTDFCVRLSQKENEPDTNDNDESEDKADDKTGFVHHPFKVKEPTMIKLNIKNAVQLPIKTPAQRTADIARLSSVFPVSSGNKHKQKELEWVPVVPETSKAEKTKPTEKVVAKIPETPSVVAALPQVEELPLPPPPPPPAAIAYPSLPPAESVTFEAPTTNFEPAVVPPMAIPPTVPPDVPFLPAPVQPATFDQVPVQVYAPPMEQMMLYPVTTVPSTSTSIFKTPKRLDIASIVTKRFHALTKLQSNPNDFEAIRTLQEAQQSIQDWVESQQVPGLFTGSTDAKVLSVAELCGPTKYYYRSQKNILSHAPPVTEGKGMSLLKKMGWNPGEGLGKNKEGNLEPLVLDIKTDKKGLVSEGENSKKGVSSFFKELQGKHPVSALMELCSKRKWKPPLYTCVMEHGPPHKKVFTFKVEVNGVEYQPVNPSSNKKVAKADAAVLCLQALNVLPKAT